MTERRRETSTAAPASRRRFLETAALGGAAVVFAGSRRVAADAPTRHVAGLNADAGRLAALVDRYGPEFGPRKVVR